MKHCICHSYSLFSFCLSFLCMLCVSATLSLSHSFYHFSPNPFLCLSFYLFVSVCLCVCLCLRDVSLDVFLFVSVWLSSAFFRTCPRPRRSQTFRCSTRKFQVLKKDLFAQRSADASSLSRFPRMNKREIREYLQAIYKVDVQRVNTQIVLGNVYQQFKKPAAPAWLIL